MLFSFDICIREFFTFLNDQKNPKHLLQNLMNNNYRIMHPKWYFTHTVLNIRIEEEKKNFFFVPFLFSSMSL